MSECDSLAIEQRQLDKSLGWSQKTDDLSEIKNRLLQSAHSLSNDNYGDSWTLLHGILKENHNGLWRENKDDLLRLIQLFLKRGYGGKLLESLIATGCSKSYTPLYHALEASVNGKDLLNNCNPEVKNIAESIYNWINNVSKD